MSSLRERALVPVLIFVGAVVAVVSSLGAPLIPRLAERLDTTVANAQWALTATVVVAAVASPVVGRLGDGRHRKRVIVVCMALVVLGGVLAAVATTLAVLIVGRALQGLGLALMPLTMATARAHLPAERSGRVIAALSVVAAAGVGLGYPITGFIADHGGVAAAYWVGTIVSAAALVLAAWVIPAPEDTRAQAHLDLLGAILVGIGLVSILVALDKAADWGWGSVRVPTMLVVGVVLIAVWSVHELRTAHPLVELRLLQNRAVLTANVSGLLLGVTMYLAMTEITQFVQRDGFGLGESVFVAGLTLLPLSIMSTAASMTLPWLQSKVGLRPVIPAGAIFVAAGLVLFGLTATALWQTFLTMGLIGIGLGYTFAAMPGLIVTAVPIEETGSAMGFYQVSRFVGFAIGSGLAVTLLRAFGTDGEPTLASYQSTAFVAAGVGLVTALLAWVLPGTSRSRPASASVRAAEVEEGLLGAAGLEDRDGIFVEASSSPRPPTA